MSEKLKDLVCVAVIAGAHGVHGAVKVKSYTQNPEDFSIYGPLLDEAGQIILTPKNPRPVGNAFTMRSPEIKTREQALGMKGALLYVPRAAFPDIEDEDDFYYSDLIGLEVKTSDGKRAGTVKAVHEFGAGDMLEVQPPKSAEKQASWFHPFTKLAVPKVDIKGRRLVIHIEDAVIGHDPNKGNPNKSDLTQGESNQDGQNQEGENQTELSSDI